MVRVTNKLISKIRLNEINKLKIADLAEGDMGPKVRASLTFIENGGKEAVIGNLKRLSESLDGYCWNSHCTLTIRYAISSSWSFFRLSRARPLFPQPSKWLGCISRFIIACNNLFVIN